MPRPITAAASLQGQGTLEARGLLLPKQPTANEKLVGNATKRAARRARGRARPFFATYRAVHVTCSRSCGAWSFCYAAAPGHTRMHQEGRASDNDGPSFEAWTLTLPARAVVRLHVSGDLMTPNWDGTGSEQIDAAYLAHIISAARARPDVTLYTYTHGWRMLGPVAALDLPPNLTINASADTPADVADAIALGYPVTTIVSDAVEWKRRAGYVVCPEQSTGIPCADCGLCWDANRAWHIAFKVHGANAKLYQPAEGIALELAG